MRLCYGQLQHAEVDGERNRVRVSRSSVAGTGSQLFQVVESAMERGPSTSRDPDMSRLIETWMLVPSPFAYVADGWPASSRYETHDRTLRERGTQVDGQGY